MRQSGLVLVGASLAGSGDPVLRSAAAIAGSMGSRLHVAHAFQLPMMDEPLAADWGVRQALQDEQEVLRQELAGRLVSLGIDGEALDGVTVAVGSPFRVVVETAEEINADLVVVGARESSSPLAHWLGSTADRVIRKATCPVWVTRETRNLPPSRILVPVDLSPLSADTLHGACTGIGGLVLGRQPELMALWVLNSTLRKELLVRYQTEPIKVPDCAGEELVSFLANVVPNSRQVGSRLRLGEVTEGILAEIEQWRPDLVVMGTHGRGGFERFLIGSVAEGVIRHADCDVLVIPPEAAVKASLAREPGARTVPSVPTV